MSVTDRQTDRQSDTVICQPSTYNRV